MYVYDQPEQRNQFSGTGDTIPPCSRPSSNLVWAILSTVLCCLPLGIVAIIKAASVDGLWNQGRYEEAVKASKSAMKFSIFAAVASILFIILYVLLIAVGVLGTIGLADMMDSAGTYI